MGKKVTLFLLLVALSGSAAMAQDEPRVVTPMNWSKAATIACGAATLVGSLGFIYKLSKWKKHKDQLEKAEETGLSKEKLDEIREKISRDKKWMIGLGSVSGLSLITTGVFGYKWRNQEAPAAPAAIEYVIAGPLLENPFALEHENNMRLVSAGLAYAVVAESHDDINTIDEVADYLEGHLGENKHFQGLLDARQDIVDVILAGDDTRNRIHEILADGEYLDRFYRYVALVRQDGYEDGIRQLLPDRDYDEKDLRDLADCFIRANELLGNRE